MNDIAKGQNEGLLFGLSMTSPNTCELCNGKLCRVIQSTRQILSMLIYKCTRIGVQVERHSESTSCDHLEVFQSTLSRVTGVFRLEVQLKQGGPIQKQLILNLKILCHPTGCEESFVTAASKIEISQLIRKFWSLCQKC